MCVTRVLVCPSAFLREYSVVDGVPVDALGLQGRFCPAVEHLIFLKTKTKKGFPERSRGDFLIATLESLICRDRNH